MVEDVEQLVDFLLIEFQRILFAENIVHTVAVSWSGQIVGSDTR